MLITAEEQINEKTLDACEPQNKHLEPHLSQPHELAALDVNGNSWRGFVKVCRMELSVLVVIILIFPEQSPIDCTDKWSIGRVLCCFH